MRVFKFEMDNSPQKGEEGSAIPRQPVARAKQASIPWPKSKNQFNI